MFAPKRITIRNLGSIPYAVIEPHPTGITALDGPTGSGKSSAMNVVAWTLFGYIGGVDSFNRQADGSSPRRRGALAGGVLIDHTSRLIPA